MNSRPNWRHLSLYPTTGALVYLQWKKPFGPITSLIDKIPVKELLRTYALPSKQVPRLSAQPVVYAHRDRQGEIAFAPALRLPVSAIDLTNP